MLGSFLVVVVLVIGMEILQVVSFQYVLHLVLNARVGGVIALRWRGGTVDGLPFMVFILLQLGRGGSLVVVTVVVFVLVALIGVMIWFVLIPLWSKWLFTGFTLLVRDACMNPHGSFPFDYPPKSVSKGAQFWGFRCPKVCGVVGGNPSIPLNSTCFGEPNRSYGMPMRYS
jgi:hypothetical protein